MMLVLPDARHERLRYAVAHMAKTAHAHVQEASRVVAPGDLNTLAVIATQDDLDEWIELLIELDEAAQGSI